MLTRKMSLTAMAVLAGVGVVACGDDGRGDDAGIPFTAASVAQEGERFRVEWEAEDAGDVVVYAGTDPDAVGRERKVGEGATNGLLEVDGLPDEPRWYFELVPEEGEPLVVADRLLHLESVPNLRDLGGYRTEDGRWVRSGTIYRSGSLGEISDEDFATLQALGLKLVCDFRSDSEREKEPDPEIAGAEAVHLDVSDSGDLATLITNAIVSGSPEEQQRLLGDGKAAQYLVDGGKAFVSEDSARTAYSRMFDRLADPESLPTLIHCTGGKDRAGWGSAAVLSALGVPRETVEADYLLTNEILREENEVTLARTAALLQRDMIEPLLLARTEYLDASFDEVEAVHGGFEDYLEEGLDVDDEQLDRIEESLLAG